MGHINHPIDFGRIGRWKSNFIRVIGITEQLDIPDGQRGWKEYTDNELDFLSPVPGADVTVAITEYALQDNFYIRRLSSSVVVISLYETADVIEAENIPLEYFILRNLYEFYLLHHIYHPIPPTREGIPNIIHNETRSCLFDMCGEKYDVIFSTGKPSLCNQCKANLAAHQLPDGALVGVERELRRIRKPRYYRISDWVKQRPVRSLVIASVGAICTGAVGNGVYDLLKLLFSARK